MKNFKPFFKSASRALVALGLGVMVSPTLFAAAPAEINYQGKLTDSSGIPFNGTKNITFSFWDNASVGAGSQLGGDKTVNNVNVVNGVFNAVIDVSGIPFLTNQNVYLQIRIDGSNFGPSRQKLVAAPFALAVAAGAVGTTELAANAVTSAKIVDGTIAAADLAVGAITVSGGFGGSITDGTVDANDLAAGAVTSAKILDGTIATGDLTNNAIDVNKLAADAVTSAKILDGTIATGDLANNAIDVNKLAADAVTSAKILDGTIASGDLANNAVTSAKIQDGTIVNADFSATAADALAASKVKGGTFASGTAFVFPDQVTMQGDLVVGSGGTALAKYLSAIRNYDVPNLTADTSDTFTITVTGAAAGDGVVVTPPSGWAASLFLNAHVSGANTVTVTVYNAGTGPVNPGSGDFRAMVFQH